MNKFCEFCNNFARVHFTVINRLLWPIEWVQEQTDFLIISVHAFSNPSTVRRFLRRLWPFLFPAADIRLGASSRDYYSALSLKCPKSPRRGAKETNEKISSKVVEINGFFPLQFDLPLVANVLVDQIAGTMKLRAKFNPNIKASTRLYRIWIKLWLNRTFHWRSSVSILFSNEWNLIISLSSLQFLQLETDCLVKYSVSRKVETISRRQTDYVWSIARISFETRQLIVNFHYWAR